MVEHTGAFDNVEPLLQPAQFQNVGLRELDVANSLSCARRA
jgi:hypothetical protein